MTASIVLVLSFAACPAVRRVVIEFGGGRIAAVAGHATHHCARRLGVWIG